MYYILYTFVFLHAILPWRVLYFLSDILYVILYKIARYRKKVVYENLSNSFPDKSHEEILQIEKKFYHHFCDYVVETMKLAHISDEEMRKRMIFKDMDMAHELMSDGRSCMMLIGHYGNWEWITSICLSLNEGIEAGQIYHYLHNKAFNKLMLKLRSRFGSVGILMKNAFREIIRTRNQGRQGIYGFIADQRPRANQADFWTIFLNQETAFISGFERIAVKADMSVAYMDVVKTKRGHYEITFKLIAENPATCENHEIVEKYAREMEKTILREPAYWLWTHKRWKKPPKPPKSPEGGLS